MCFIIQVVQSTEIKVIVGFVIKISIGLIIGFVLRPNKIVLLQSRESNSKIDAWFEKQHQPPDKSNHLSSRIHWLRFIVVLAYIVYKSSMLVAGNRIADQIMRSTSIVAYLSLSWFQVEP